MRHTRVLRTAVAVAALAVSTAGCYHATIDTGRAPSGTTIQNDWAHGFVYGLVPPATVETASKCPNGVAKVETQHSFLNSLAAGLTFGLYTPITISVQCAGPVAHNAVPADQVIALPEGADRQALARALNTAAERVSGERAPVFITFSNLE